MKISVFILFNWVRSESARDKNRTDLDFRKHVTDY